MLPTGAGCVRSGGPATLGCLGAVPPTRVELCSSPLLQDEQSRRRIAHRSSARRPSSKAPTHRRSSSTRQASIPSPPSVASRTKSSYASGSDGFQVITASTRLNFNPAILSQIIWFSPHTELTSILLIYSIASNLATFS